jgi:molybdate transport system substrate-binding protein
VRLIPIPEQLNVLARYPIAVIADSPRAEAAQAFVDFVVSSEGQAILADYGFLPAQ